jgi:hypothetical protein
MGLWSVVKAAPPAKKLKHPKASKTPATPCPSSAAARGTAAMYEKPCYRFVTCRTIISGATSTALCARYSCAMVQAHWVAVALHSPRIHDCWKVFQPCKKHRLSILSYARPYTIRWIAKAARHALTCQSCYAILTIFRRIIRLCFAWLPRWVSCPILRMMWHPRNTFHQRGIAWPTIRSAPRRTGALRWRACRTPHSSLP